MPLLSPSTWSWKGFFDLLEYVAGVLVIGFAFWSVPAAIIAASAFVGLTAKYFGKKIESRKQEAQELRNQNRAKQIARVMLESMQRFYFKDQDGVELHKHRLTLYKEVKPDEVTGLGRHLAIFARVGDHANSTRTWAVDDGQSVQCRGTAGWVWYTNHHFPKGNLRLAA
jgi:hypothetical protein